MTTLNKSVSVIVPTFNNEKSIIKCLTSLLNQNYDNYEVIVVNDGSTDNTQKIVENICEKNKKIKLISNENHGVSFARNIGIKTSVNDYILFVDADDYVESDFISKMLNFTDDVEFCICKFFEDSHQIKNDDAYFDKIKATCNKKMLLDGLISSSKYTIYGFVWRCLFKRKIILDNSITFNENIKMSEDYLFILNYLKFIEKINFVDNYLYHYCINNTSTTAKYIINLDRDMCFINDWVNDNYVRMNSNLKNGFSKCQLNTYLQIIQNSCKNGNPYINKKEQVQYIKSMRKRFISNIYDLNGFLSIRLSMQIGQLFCILKLEKLYINIYKKRLKNKY